MIDNRNGFYESSDSGNNEDDSNSTIQISDALREQLFSNFFSMLLHLSESNGLIVRVGQLNK